MNMTTITPGKTTERPFIIPRTFDVPREKVWKAWPDRDQLRQWFGLKGFKMTTAKLDLRPGRTFHYCRQTSEGKEMWGKFVYREMKAPERIVLINSFSDANGGIPGHPFSATWPLETLSTTTFTDEGGKIWPAIEWAPLNAADEECKTFDSSHDGMKQGRGGSFEQLADFLAKV
jgi:uncharacterized protein YndB with AHSA1/START domain